MKPDTKKHPIIVGIGEILWDVLEHSEELGGAPVNFAYHAGALGAEAYAISTVGVDQRGKTALAELRGRQMSTEHITVLKEAITGYVLAQIDPEGIATYTFPDNVAWDQLTIDEKTRHLAKKIDAICFGSLAQRSTVSRQVIMNYLKKEAQQALKVFDLNIRQQFYTEDIIRSSMECADVLKLNDEEIVLITEMEQLTGDEETQLKLLVKRYGLQLAVLTRGGQGSLLVSPSQVSSHSGFQTEVRDTIGAGDAFTATTILGLLKGDPIETINENANRVAAFVCSCKGAMPPLPEKFKMC